MKTKDFIKMLQEADPTGECHVRIAGSNDAILSCEYKEGYWDGDYSYYDFETDIWHKTSDGYKVDIVTINWKDIVWEEDGNIENIKKRINIEKSCHMRNEQLHGNFWDEVEKECVKCIETNKRLDDDMIVRSKKRFEDGWIFYTNNDEKPIIKGFWEKDKKIEGAVFGEIRVITKYDNIFSKEEKGDFDFYKLK